MSRLALYIILGALRPRTSAARKVQIILPQTVGNTVSFNHQSDKILDNFLHYSWLALKTMKHY